MATSVKGNRSHKAKVVVKAEGGSAQTEEKVKDTTLAALLPPVKVDTAYIISKDGLDVYMGPDAKEIIKQIQGGADTPYMFFNPRPFYLAVKNGTIQPLAFPEPKDYGTTSANLFAMGVTVADAIAEFVRLKIKGKQGLAGQLRQLGMLGMPLVIAIFLIFILAVYIGGS